MSGSGNSWTDSYLESLGIDPNGGQTAATLQAIQQAQAHYTGTYGKYNSGGGGSGANSISGASEIAGSGDYYSVGTMNLSPSSLDPNPSSSTTSGGLTYTTSTEIPDSAISSATSSGGSASNTGINGMLLTTNNGTVITDPFPGDTEINPGGTNPLIIGVENQVTFEAVVTGVSANDVIIVQTVDQRIDTSGSDQPIVTVSGPASDGLAAHI